jgi:flagellar basal-body rod modification protein FlgD
VSSIPSTNSSTGSTSASQLTANYLNLLITQLQNQDPLNPMDNSQMTSQMAQLSELQQMQDMSTSFSQVLASTQLQYATSLIGKDVSYTPSGQTTAISGQVQGVEMSGGQPMAVVNNQMVDPSLITDIWDATTTGQ